MTTFNGRDGKVTIGTDEVLEIESWSLQRTANEIDTSVFGDGWGKSDVGMKKFNMTITGFYDYTDATGQNVLEAAFESGALLQDIRIYINDTTYFAPDTVSDPNAGVRVTAFPVDHEKEGVAKISGIAMSGSGPVKRFTT